MSISFQVAMVLVFIAVLLSLALTAPPISAFDSPIPRPTLDPAWECKQLDDCPAPHKIHPPQPAYIVLPPYSVTMEPNQLIRLP